MVEKNFVRPGSKYVFPGDQAIIETVSDYAKTNVKEDYAETFAFYVSGKRIPDSVLRRWQLAHG